MYDLLKPETTFLKKAGSVGAWLAVRGRELCGNGLILQPLRRCPVSISLGSFPCGVLFCNFSSVAEKSPLPSALFPVSSPQCSCSC